jgi:hypothetical protein
MITPRSKYSAVAKLWIRCKKGFQSLPLHFIKAAPVQNKISAPGNDRNIRNPRTEEPGVQHELMYFSNKLDGSTAPIQNPSPDRSSDNAMKRYHLLSPQ